MSKCLTGEVEERFANLPTPIVNDKVAKSELVRIPTLPLRQTAKLLSKCLCGKLTLPDCQALKGIVEVAKLDPRQ